MCKDEAINFLFNEKNIAVILGGLPGSGKSTLAEKFVSRQYLCICKDTIRYEFAKMKFGDKPESLLDEHLQKFSRYCHPVIADMTESYFNKSPVFHSVNFSKMDDEMKAFAKQYISKFDYSTFSGIVYDATYFTRQQRKIPLELIKGRLDAFSIFINKPISSCFKNVQKRSETIIGNYDNKPVYGRFVPFEVLENMNKATVLPKKSEGFKNVYIIANDF